MAALPDALTVAIAVAREAGALVADRFRGGAIAEAKGRFDVVTDADRASEALILARLRDAYPSVPIVSEEAGVIAASGSCSAPTDWCWHVDPLDGTKNFARGFPSFAVSLALERGGVMVLGVTFDPLRQELFAAEQGGGARCNAAPIHVSTIGRLDECLLATGFPSARRHADLVPGPLRQLMQVGLDTQGVRRTGSSALDLCYVACGRLDAFWDAGLPSWDTAAGVVLVTEAGGRCSTLSGAPYTATALNLLAANPRLHEALLPRFTEAHDSVPR